MNERDELLATVATLYYKLNQSQGEIAARFEISASQVSRMLKEARERNIVTIHIHLPIPRNFELEQALMQRFGLKDVYVLQAGSDSDETHLLRATGQLAAGYLQRVVGQLPAGASVGIAWGTGVHAAISALPDNLATAIDAIQLMGGVGALNIDGPDLSRMIAVKLGGRHHDLHAPVLVEQPAVRELFLAEPTVRDSIMRARAVHLAITGIGAMADEASSFLRAGLIKRSELAQLRAVGAAGEMCGRFFDIHGNDGAIPINARIIGIDLPDLRHIPIVLAVARGAVKAPALLGALRGRYFNVLATDEQAAQAVLQLDSEHR
jgi:DNA-binding transcriptional regulator LsrR (DeoR family)